MCLAVPMEILSIDGEMAVVDQAGVKKTVSLMVCDEPPQVGDFVIVHAGFAIRRIDPEAAEESMEYLRQIAAAAEAEGEL